ncbi:uncharacterized protein DS421_13g428870 [Arachis hypogaea]|nr:uncharacterized protein DS421_13g428870 [Arachis hypogaea]
MVHKCPLFIWRTVILIETNASYSQTGASETVLVLEHKSLQVNIDVLPRMCLGFSSSIMRDQFQSTEFQIFNNNGNAQLHKYTTING